MLPTLESHPNPLLKNVGHPYLKLQLAPQLHAALSMDCAQEALILPAEQLTSVPNMPHYMLGLLNRRGRIYWVIDLPTVLGLTSSVAALRNYPIVLVKVNGHPLGWAVPQIQEVLRSTETVLPIGAKQCPSQVKPFVRGGLAVASEQLLILDPATIFDAAASPTVYSSSADFAIHR